MGAEVPIMVDDRAAHLTPPPVSCLDSSHLTNSGVILQCHLAHLHLIVVAPAILGSFLCARTDSVANSWVN